MKSSEYYINYYGKKIDIEDTSKILCLFTSGGGYGDGGEDRSWASYYKLYTTSNFGETLTEVGEASEYGRGYEVHCKFTINGDTHIFSNLCVEQFFHKIFKRD